MNTEVKRQDGATVKDELLTVDELRVLLKVSKGWIYNRIYTKTLPFPHIKVGYYPRFPLSGVLQFIESHTQPGTPA